MHLTTDEHACTSADYTIETEGMMLKIDLADDDDALSMRQGSTIPSKHLFRPVLDRCPALTSV